MKNNKKIMLPLAKILDDFGIKRQSFYAINKKYEVFKKEKFGYYSTKIQAYEKIKEYYQAKRVPKHVWKPNTKVRT